jgi:hypothetical protein
VKELKLDFLVAIDYTAIVATMVALLESCSFVQTIESVDLNYSAHDFRRISAHYRDCSFSIVKPSVKVITIETSADALSMSAR